MPPETAYNQVLGDLRSALMTLKADQKTYDEKTANRDLVFAKYRPIFSTDHVSTLSKDEFTSFLYPENNHHWSGLYRQGLRVGADMDTLRKALGILLDENKPIQERFPLALGMVEGLGKATATAILTVAYPDVYGVWNNTSEGAMRKRGLWPNFDKGEGVGARYTKINSLLARLRSDLKTDFWILDWLWWSLVSPGRAPDLPQAGTENPSQSGGFALERQLEEFLLENWDRTPLSSEWAIYSTSEDPEAGNQFPTDVGPVDILAVHKTQPRLLVVELKRKQSTDQTVGQVLRYMGWVEKHVAKEMGKTVEGLIIAREVDKGASYALSLLPHIRMMTYEIEFKLKPCGTLPE
jgi:Endonuclease NucS